MPMNKPNVVVYAEKLQFISIPMATQKIDWEKKNTAGRNPNLKDLFLLVLLSLGANVTKDRKTNPSNNPLMGPINLMYSCAS